MDKLFLANKIAHDVRLKGLIEHLYTELNKVDTKKDVSKYSIDAIKKIAPETILLFELQDLLVSRIKELYAVTMFDIDDRFLSMILTEFEASISKK
ncbi:MAG TPA: hypothetical protein PKV22_00090 [Paludibacteraceae bacterium]|nr:hypothetical protein [Paludibacteraceae bacterium]HQH66323.1 hypothetical protein [Clostridia bacterium]